MGLVPASPPKKVQFDENNIKETKKDLDVSKPKDLKEWEDEILKLKQEKKWEKRNTNLSLFVQNVNEKVQNMPLSTPEEQKEALDLLNNCIRLIDQNTNIEYQFPELYYETYNNLARCMNLKGDIKQSLYYLEFALRNVDKIAQTQEEGTVTIIPEVCLNICNAHIYMKDNVMALEYAHRAINSSKLCINSISRKLDRMKEKKETSSLEYNRLYVLFTS